MTTSPLDIVLFALLAIAIVVETIRGFGCASFDLVAVYTALLLTKFVASFVAQGVPASFDRGAVTSVSFIATFVCLSAVCIGISTFSSSSVRLNLGMLDKIAAFGASVFVGIVVCHAVVAGLASGGTDQVSATNGTLSQEVLTFGTYHSIVNHLYSVTSPSTNNS